MSQPIAANQFSHGAGKGSHERPLDRARFSKNFDEIRWTKSVSGKMTKRKDGKIRVVYR